MNSSGIILAFLVVISTLFIGISSKVIAKREVDHSIDAQFGSMTTAEKRPFCNAFTGCGRKRSDANSFGTDIDVSDSTDPMVQLTRKIIHDAKQWEMLRQRLAYNEMLHGNGPVFDYMNIRRRRSIDNYMDGSIKRK